MNFSKILHKSKLIIYCNDFLLVRNSSTVSRSIVDKCNDAFDEERKRQLEDVGRIEKINVKVIGMPEEINLVMNRNISTPFDCAKHVSKGMSHRAALAVVDGTAWDIHSPLVDNCNVELLTFRNGNAAALNRAFWRSCSFMLGSVVANAFKDNVTCHLHSFPPPNVRSGSFVYDVTLGLDSWNPTEQELRVLSAQMVSLAQAAHPFYNLKVSQDVALQLLEGNPHKESQIPEIASKSPDGKVSVYRVGRHIDISRGPLIGNTSFLGRCAVTAVHRINDLHRFQGVALPRDVLLNHFAFGILTERAQKLNRVGLPAEEYEAVNA